MKKCLISFLLLCLPTICWAGDHCTNPKQYTVDKRCYVTDAQKKTAPYNAVVAFVGSDGNNSCTGTIVDVGSDNLYVVTAKHCTAPGCKNNDSVSVCNPNKNLTIRLQDGTKRTVTFNNAGNYDIKKNTNKSGDWAFYKLGTKEQNKNIAFAKLAVPLRTQRDFPLTQYQAIEFVVDVIKYDKIYDAIDVGYGNLSIMSDQQIRDFKQKYITWLVTQDEIFSAKTGANYGGIDPDNEYVLKFAKENKEYWNSVRNDVARLKLSKCKYDSVKNAEIQCQTSGGNSGGGIFNRYGALMGIHTRGWGNIGGTRHALAAGSVMLLKKQ